MRTQWITPRLVSLICLVLVAMAALPSPARVTTFTITTQVVAGGGWIETIEPNAPVPMGASKHYRIHPARGWMISDVQIDGQSIGPSMYATVPFVQTDHTIRASFEPFDQIEAANLSTKLTGPARVLIIGETSSSNRIAEYLRSLQPQDTGVTIWVEHWPLPQGNDLLTEYYLERTGPASRNHLLNKIAEGWDYVIPIDLYNYQSLLPELHLEGVRLIANRAWFEGGQARVVLPMLWTSNNAAKDLDKIAGHVYRIANAMHMPVVPVGQAWATLVDSHGVTDTSVEGMSNAAAYLFAAMLSVQFFEQKPDANVAVPNIDAAVVSAINDVAWSTWQNEKTEKHYSGAYSGVATPFKANGGRAYHFGTSTRGFSVDKMPRLIAGQDPELDDFTADGSSTMENATTPGDVQDNLSNYDYTYMWRQWKGEDSRSILNQTIRGQFQQDPYFIWYERYMDRTADVNAGRIGLAAFKEVTDALTDNLDTANNPNRKSRAPQTHIGWGRIWEERTDIQMMENLDEKPAHAHDVLMSMFAAQTYALLTGRDASRYGSWQYDPDTEPDLAENARYAQRVGFETIMQHGTLDINEPYDQSPHDRPVFNPSSIFYTPPRTVYAQDDFYIVPAGQTLTVTAPGVLDNDSSLPGETLTVAWKESQPINGEVIQAPDGAFIFTPQDDKGVVWFRYAASDGDKESNVATVWVQIVDSIPTEKTHLPFVVK